MRNIFIVLFIILIAQPSIVFASEPPCAPSALPTISANSNSGSYYQSRAGDAIVLVTNNVYQNSTSCIWASELPFKSGSGVYTVYDAVCESGARGGFNTIYFEYYSGGCSSNECSDGMKGANEVGIDCGGSCSQNECTYGCKPDYLLVAQFGFDPTCILSMSPLGGNCPTGFVKVNADTPYEACEKTTDAILKDNNVQLPKENIEYPEVDTVDTDVVIDNVTNPDNSSTVTTTTTTTETLSDGSVNVTVNVKVENYSPSGELVSSTDQGSADDNSSVVSAINAERVELSSKLSEQTSILKTTIENASSAAAQASADEIATLQDLKISMQTVASSATQTSDGLESLKVSNAAAIAAQTASLNEVSNANSLENSTKHDTLVEAIESNLSNLNDDGLGSAGNGFGEDNVYDPSFAEGQLPEKSDIALLISDSIGAFPLFAVLDTFELVPASSECTFTASNIKLGAPNNSTWEQIEFDFCQWAPDLSIFGTMLLLITQAYAVLVVVGKDKK